MLDPETGLFLFIVGGIGTVASFTLFKTAEEAGPKLTMGDLRPAAPWEGLPLPVFLYKKPELLAELRKR